MVSLRWVGEVFEVRTQVDRDLTTVSRVDRRLRLIKNLGHHTVEPGQDGPGPVGPSRPAGLAHSGGRFGPPFLAPEGSSTLKSGRRCHLQEGEPFAPGGHPQAIERGGRSPEVDRPSRRKHPQVKKKEDIVRSVTMFNGAMCSTLMG
jgi:hypothetical protein